MRPIVVADKQASERVNATMNGLKPGAYSILWLVLAVDGRITRGEVPFQVR